MNVAIPCATCGSPAPLTAHRLFEGTRARPVRIWTVIAPLYFAANATFTAMVAGFCSAACSLAWRAAP